MVNFLITFTVHINCAVKQGVTTHCFTAYFWENANVNLGELELYLSWVLFEESLETTSKKIELANPTHSKLAPPPKKKLLFF